MSLWDGLSDQQKEKIIDAIVESFSLFREYFQQRKDA
jgi:Trm5-related predicted tRNA methylase